MRELELGVCLREKEIRRIVGREVSCCDHMILTKEGIITVQDKWRDTVKANDVKAFVLDSKVLASRFDKPLVRGIFASKVPLTANGRRVLCDANGTEKVFVSLHDATSPAALARLVARSIPPDVHPEDSGKGETSRNASPRTLEAHCNFAEFVSQFVYSPSSDSNSKHKLMK